MRKEEQLNLTLEKEQVYTSFVGEKTPLLHGRRTV